MLKRFIIDESGATAIEYGLICAMIFLAVVTAISAVADQNTEMYDYIGTKVIEALSRNN